jgi:ABC-type branched-subunit amino acid transport system substrate-binding protein
VDGGGSRDTEGRRRRSLVFALIGALLACILAVSASAKTTRQAASDAKVITIGENIIQSGVNAGSAPISEGFEAYLDYTNKHGGVNGYTFKWIAKDNGSTASQAALVQNELLAANPFLIFAVGTVPFTSAAAVSKSQNSTIPLLVSGDGGLVQSLSHTQPGPIFTYVPDSSYLGPFDARFVMTKLKDKHPGLVWENDALASSAAPAIDKYVQKNGGSLSANISVAATTTDLVPIVSQLKADGTKTVMLWVNTGLVSSFQKAAAQIGYSPQWVTPFFSLNSTYLRLAGKLANGTYVDGILPTQGAEVQKFAKAMRTYYPQGINGTGEQGWEAGSIVVAAIEKATANKTALTQAGFAKALRSLHGKIGFANIDFRHRNWGISGAMFFQVQNQRFVQVGKFTPFTG